MNNSKKIFLSVLGLLFAVFTLTASEECQQQQGKQKSKVAEFIEQKREYLTREVGMTKEESDRFFPLYEQLQKDKFKLNKEVRTKIKHMGADGKEITAKEYLEAARSMNDLRQKEARLEDEYFRKFENILPPQKLYKLQIAENNFNREMMKRFSPPGERRRGATQSK